MFREESGEEQRLKAFWFSPGYWGMQIRRLNEKRKGLDFIQPMNFEEAGTDSQIAQYYHASHDKVIRMAIEYVLAHNCKVTGFFDYGCGKGWVLYMASKYGFSHLGGVELSKKIVDIAQRNMIKLGIDNIDIICGDARNCHDIDDYDVFYFYNPFPEVVMEPVVKNIQDSQQRNCRKIFIIYFNPVHAQCFEKEGIKKIYEFSTKVGLRRKASLPVYIYEM